MGVPEAFALAFLIGIVCGLRSMTGPAVVCWGAHLHWLHLENSPLHFLQHPASLIVFSLFAIGELIADKLPFIPRRTEPGPLVVRIIVGAMCGAAFCSSGGASWIAGAFVGAVGGVGGAFAGYHARRLLVVQAHWPDMLVALCEDLIAVGGGFLLVSRF